jgi:hypothetical protein
LIALDQSRAIFAGIIQRLGTVSSAHLAEAISYRRLIDEVPRAAVA